MSTYNSVTRTKKHRRKRTTIYKWLRDRTSSIDYGFKYKGHPIHCNRNRDVLNAFNDGRWLSRMTNEKFDDHFSGTKTFYFTGTGKTKSKETLVCIDIDCHSCGTLAGAIQFAEHLKAHHFPGLYYEVSTNGNGVHAYVVVEKFDLGSDILNQCFRRLDQHLKSILLDTKCDVENVEVKGTCPSFIWGGRKGELLNYTSGQLAKLPREAHRFEELKATTKISYLDLLKLPGEHKREFVSQSSGKGAVSAAASPVGSISGRVICDEELAELTGHYLDVARLLMETHQLATTGRSVATASDVAIFLMLVRFFTLNMNADGSLPYARFKGLWAALHETRDIDRPFDDKRFAAVRNYVSSLGLLDWEDETYVIGSSNGKRGQACRWKASEMLMSWLDWQELRKQGDECEKQSCCARYEERGERAPLAGTQIREAIQLLTRTPDNEVTRPILRDEPAVYLLSPDDIAPYVAAFEEFWRVAA